MCAIVHVGIFEEKSRYGNNLSTLDILVSDLRASLEDIFDITQVRLLFYDRCIMFSLRPI